MNRKERILIVDDDESTRKSLSLIFGKKGYDIEMARTGQEALEKARGDFFNLALLDIKLPDMEGVELLTPLKEMHPDMATIMVTAYASLETAVRALNKEASAYITKPLNVDKVLATIRETLEKQHLVMENRRLYETLRESEEKFRNIYEASPIGIELYDSEGQLIDANKACLDIFGVSDTKEIKGVNLFEDPNVSEEIKEKLRQGESARYKVLFCFDKVRELKLYKTTKSGSIHLNVSITLLGLNGRKHPQSYLVQIQDITERVQAEEERAALIAELEAKNAELERFTYTVSHDLKSPLITIQGFVGLLQQDALAGDAERMKTDADFISNAVNKMEQLLNELLELSRIGRVVNPSEDVPLSGLVHEAMDLVTGQLNERGVQVEIVPELLGPNGPTVYGDRPRLREVLQNLIDNAAKYMGDQPDPRVKIGMRRDGAETVFFVRDNGIGIDPRYHDKIFDLFDKLDARSEGTGVGLTIVKRIVEVHGGQVWVESKGEGHGSAFCFTLAGA